MRRTCPDGCFISAHGASPIEPGQDQPSRGSPTDLWMWTQALLSTAELGWQLLRKDCVWSFCSAEPKGSNVHVSTQNQASFILAFTNALIYSANMFLSLSILSTALERLMCLRVSGLSLDPRERKEVTQAHIRKVLWKEERKWSHSVMSNSLQVHKL